jgi:Down-regulated in metastasis
MEHTKVVDDTNSKNRLRFASSRKRSLSATADVYRNAKRQAGTTAAGREALVHHPRCHNSENPLVLPEKINKDDSDASTFSEELDIAMDRNSSEIFFRFHRAVWPLVRSLPELLHHSEQVVDLLLSYLLSPEESSDTSSSKEVVSPAKRPRYVPNLATADILHLLGVLAKDLRHEIHRFLHEKIMPRIIYDLLTQAPKPDSQETPMQVGFIEAAFRTLSYMFRYDSQMLLAEVPKNDGKKTDDSIPCLESMRQYYGVTLAHRREIVRRLAAESFAPLIRMSSHRSKHLKRVLRALAASQTSGRTQFDAIDGIARLLFEVARGASGKLHSKGTVAIQAVLDVLAGSLSDSGRGCILDVGLELFSMLRNMLDDMNLHEALTLLIDASSKQAKKGDDSACFILPLLTSVVSECRLSRNICQKILDPVCHIVKDVSTQKPIGDQDPHLRDNWIDLIVSLWSNLSDDADAARVLSPLLQTFWSYAIVEPSDPVVGRLVDSLFPNIKLDILMSTVGSQILASTAAMPNNDGSLQLLHALASIPSAMNKESDDCYSIDHAADITVSDESKLLLLDEFLGGIDEHDDAKSFGRIKVVAFLTPVQTGSADHELRNYRKIGRYLKSIVIARCNSGGVKLVKDDVVLASAAMEAVARITSFCLKSKQEVLSEIKKLLVELQPQALRLLRSEPASLPVLKAVALLVETFQFAELSLTGKAEEINALFDAIVPNLCCENHFVRLHSLFLLKSLPKRPFIVDHAELDFQGDLDEEIDENPRIRDGVALNGMCNICESLYEIESTLPSLRNERHLSYLLETVGVLGQSGRLPVVYAEAAATHVLGVFFIRFSSLWKAAATAFRGIAKGHHEIAWPILQKQLRIMMDRAPRSENDVDNTGIEWSILTFRKAFDAQLGLMKSLDHHPLFRMRSSKAGKYGQVSRFISTDTIAVTENLWKVAEESPKLLVAKGSDFSSIVIRFMVHQFYAVNPNDPSSKELNLEQHIAPEENPGKRTCAELLDTRIVLLRLTSMLKAFCAITQPRQLRLDETLLMVFTSLVGHWDCDIAKLSFQCVLRYRLSFIFPYSDLLLRFFDKFGFRDALMNLREASETGVLLTDHQRNLAPLLARLLFGRLSAKSTVKSSKDSPSARRNAAMSFVAAFTKSDEDIYPLVYLITRGYLPPHLCNIPVENQNEQHRASVVSALQFCRPEDALQMPTQLHKGFLNNLESMLANLQFKLSTYVPAFLSLTLAITKAYEVTASLKTTDSASEIENQAVAEATSGAKAVRSLCYRRLGEIFASFSDQEHVLQRVRCLLDAIQNSFPLLPSMVADAEKPPALLVLLKTLAQQKTIFPSLVATPDCIPNLIRCFSTRLKQSVTCTVLDVVEIMVDEQGQCMSADHIGLLLSQYQSRLCHSANDYPTWRRELDVLLRLSKIIDVVDKASASRNAISISRVLIMFLHTRGSDEDKLKVGGVLRYGLCTSNCPCLYGIVAVIFPSL